MHVRIPRSRNEQQSCELLYRVEKVEREKAGPFAGFFFGYIDRVISQRSGPSSEEKGLC